MERTYHAGNRSEPLFLGLAFFVFGLLFVLIGLVLLLRGSLDRTVPDGRGPTLIGLLPLAGGLLLVYLGWNQLFRQPVRILIGLNGVVEVQYGVTNRRINITHIRALEKKLRKAGIEGDDARMLDIVHTRGVYHMYWFPEMEAFIADLRAFNPGIDVIGDWPVTDP